jgi:hypothetical protein
MFCKGVSRNAAMQQANGKALMRVTSVVAARPELSGTAQLHAYRPMRQIIGVPFLYGLAAVSLLVHSRLRMASVSTAANPDIGGSEGYRHACEKIAM